MNDDALARVSAVVEHAVLQSDPFIRTRLIAQAALAEAEAAYASDVRALEDAALALWHELPTEESLELRAEVPRLMDFMAHLHHRVEHEQAMVRVNVWSEPVESSGTDE